MVAEHATLLRIGTETSDDPIGNAIDGIFVPGWHRDDWPLVPSANPTGDNSHEGRSDCQYSKSDQECIDSTWATRHA
jgi:hypothetical protein